MRVLVVEDQKKMLGFIRKGLEALTYSVDTAESGGAAEALAAGTDYDVIILDAMLPDQSGLDTARHLRRDGCSTPILMLTALSGTKDKINGLDAGADDYLTKPFEFDELAARIRALLRRHSASPAAKLNFGDIEMDLVQRKVSRDGKNIPLTTKEFALLEFFLRNPNRVLTRATIGEHVWDVRFDTQSNVIDVYVNMLRKKIDQPFDRKVLQTIVGAGYVLREAE